jgi:hypothetical protein
MYSLDNQGKRIVLTTRNHCCNRRLYTTVLLDDQSEEETDTSSEDEPLVSLKSKQTQSLKSSPKEPKKPPTSTHPDESYASQDKKLPIPGNKSRNNPPQKFLKKMTCCKSTTSLIWKAKKAS